MKTKNRILKVTSYAQRPRLLLGGVWLEHAGFKPGDKVEISNPEHGQLTIKLATPPEDGEPDDSQPAITKTAEPKSFYYRSLTTRTH